MTKEATPKEISEDIFSGLRKQYPKQEFGHIIGYAEDKLKEYAKETAIGFHNWFKDMAKETLGGYNLPMQTKVYSIEELYEYYLKNAAK